MGATQATSPYLRIPGIIPLNLPRLDRPKLIILKTESLFHTYSQFSTSSNISPKPTEDEQKTEAQILDILERVLSPFFDFQMSPLTDVVIPHPSKDIPN